LEVHDGVLVAVELGLVEQAAGAVHQPAEDELGVAADALAIEARKQRRARRPVETLVVEEHPDAHPEPLSFFPACPKSGALRPRPGAKGKVNRNDIMGAESQASIG